MKYKRFNINNKLKKLTPNRKTKTKFKFIDFTFNFDKKLFFSFLILIFLGIIFVFSATISFSYWYSPDKNQYYFLINQIRNILIGFAIALALVLINKEIIFKYYKIFYILCVLILTYLIYLAVTGQAEIVDGANRWITIGIFQIQPSEFVKLAFIIFLAPFLEKLYNFFLSKKKDKTDKIKYFIYFLILLSLILILIILTKNLGSAIILALISLISFWVISQTKFEKTLFVIFLLTIFISGIIFSFIEGYRMDRIKVWLNYIITNDTLIEENGTKTRESLSYQLDQSLISISNGGIFGVGLGKSLGKYYLPKTSAGDDSIFAVIAEELGLLLTSIILIIFTYLVLRLIKIAQNAKKIRDSIFLVSVASWILIQLIVHVGANIGLLPLTGQTLPFISTGGSSLISLMMAIGICLNISKETYVINQ